MILFKRLRERLILVEYENKRMARRIKEIEKQLKPMPPMRPEGRIIIEPYKWDISYSTLRKKYRDYKEIFDNDI